MINNPKKIVISRTDSIGDVILTLPIAGILKEKYPSAKIIFLGNTYTKSIISCSNHIDEIWEWAKIEMMSLKEMVHWLTEQHVDVFIHVFPRKILAQAVRQAKIPHRIGTSHRLFHFLNCNYRPNFTRKGSDLHEAQLNTKLLSPLDVNRSYSLSELQVYAGFKKISPLPEKFNPYFAPNKKTLVLHSKSQGSAVEWGVDNFIALSKTLDQEKFIICFTGTEKEASFFRDKIPTQKNVHDLSGKMSLDELISFINQSDGLVAASTGPLHIAGVCNKYAFGLFSAKRPIHSGRWKPLGKNAVILESKKNLEATQPLSIELREVEKAIESALNK